MENPTQKVISRCRPGRLSQGDAIKSAPVPKKTKEACSGISQGPIQEKSRPMPCRKSKLRGSQKKMLVPWLCFPTPGRIAKGPVFESTISFKTDIGSGGGRPGTRKMTIGAEPMFAPPVGPQRGPKGGGKWDPTWSEGSE